MLEATIALISTTALLLGSPGPAPIALAASGASFGIKNRLPFLTGIILGLAIAIAGAALGLATLFSTFPNAKNLVQIIGGAYICYIAYKIATSSLSVQNEKSNAPTIRDGFIFNLLNPKAYAAFLAIFSQFLLPATNIIISYFLTGLVCILVALVVDSIWLLFGNILRPVFSKPEQAKVTRLFLAIGMVIAVVWSFL
ncbi:LysE family translocator [Agarilytica rhodophyticola]|uniref:LysE family translocator n=1 Tax=Agarilytica rhodophyticola TaxID=1737490 RepID=UPI000B3468CC|nr:LysE family translocator [Agarilytica rhodophyticola]